MKLYATTTSERASKGQGGNNWLRTEYFVGSAAESIPVATFLLTKEMDGYRLQVRIADDNVQEILLNEKGEKQKAH